MMSSAVFAYEHFILGQANAPRGERNLDPIEKITLVGEQLVPLETFTNDELFQPWLREQEKNGYLISGNILAARGLFLDTLKKQSFTFNALA